MKNHCYTFQQFNDEINNFYKYLKDNKYTDEEIRKILAPVLPSPSWRLPKLPIFIFFLLLVLYVGTHNETLSWHLSAIGRILLIKMLPFWNWTPLKNERCLIQKPASTTEELLFNCDLCESIQQVHVYEEISPEFLKNRYLDVDNPVIVKTTNLTFLIEDLLQNPVISSSRPCRLATNVLDSIPTVKDLIERTTLFDSFFLHFQNCDFEAMKQFRQYSPRPLFLPPELSPVQYNWLLWSRDYNVTQFKPLGLVEKVAVVWQILGGNSVRLVPRRNCREECQLIEVKLRQGEAVVVTNLWDVEYRPEWGRNLAVVLELH